MPTNPSPQPEAPEEQPEAAEQPASPPPPPPAAAPLAGNRFFAWMRSLNLTREPGWVGGVAAGIAARLGVDPLIVRGIIVVVAVLGGPAFLLYAAAWLLLPDQNDKIHLEEVFKGRLDSPIAGIGALILLSMLPVTQGFWFAGSAYWGEPFWGASAGRALWTIVVLGLLVWFVVWVARRSSRASNAPLVTPATTDDRPDTVPEPAPTMIGPAEEPAGPGVRPPAPAATASAEEFAAWRQQQAQWKAENDAFRVRQATEQHAASLAAQAQYRAERAARRAIEQAHHARTRSNPLYSFIFIGSSFVVGGLTTLAVGGGAITGAALLAGLGAMLAVLAVAIIVNGARGKRPGGSQGVAAVVLTVLLVAAIVPQGPNISYTDDVRFEPQADDYDWTNQVYFVGTGDTEIDLTDFYADPLQEGMTQQYYDNFTLVSGVGDVTVIVPTDAEFYYNASIGREPGDRDVWVNRADSFNMPPVATNELTEIDRSARVANLNITMGVGELTIERAPATGNTIEGTSE
ncbi:PspC domain-containing protein [Conyzicola sp.]|uniref:PspC domain-containing protein n=1 Tax=Conyzicola sp. TaxID=1969404 RepID=UPI003988C26C